jgi:hypothetical protein
MSPNQFVALVSALEAGCLGMVTTLELAAAAMPDDRTKALIRSVAGSAISLHYHATAIREEIEKQVMTGNHDSKEPAVCQHPEEERIPMAVMGHPHRFQCNACKQTVD